MNIENFNAALQTLTALEIEALKSAFESSKGNGHDFGFTDEITVAGQSRQAAGALVTSLMKKSVIDRDDEFGQFAFGGIYSSQEIKFVCADAVEAFLADK